MNMSLSLFEPWWVVWFLWSLVALVVSLYVPGSALVSRLKLKSLSTHYCLAWAVGLAAWGAQGVVFGYLHARWLTFGYLAIGMAWLWQNRQTEVARFRQGLVAWRQLPRWVWLLVVVGTFIQVWPVIGTGWNYGSGVNFYRINAYDGVMHLAYAEELAHHFPPQEPGAAWLALTKYHYWSDVVIGELARVWQLPITHLVFQIAPLGLSLLTAAGTYVLLKKWSHSDSTAGWGLVFLYGAGELTYLFMLVTKQTWGFFTPAIDNGAMQFLNLPHCFAKAVFMAGLIALTEWSKPKASRWWLPVVVILEAALVGFKVYFGMFAALGLVCLLAWQWLTTGLAARQSLHVFLRQIWWPSVTVGLVGLVMMAIFFPVNQHAGGLFYSPLEWPKLFLSPENINWPGWWLRHQVYEQAQSWKGLLALDTAAIAICLLCVYGTRLLGLWPRRWWRITGWPLFMYLSIPTLLFGWLGLFTLQESGLFNVFNFFAVSSIPLSLASAVVVASWWHHGRWFGKLSVLALIAITLPRVIHTTWFYTDTYVRQTVERQVPNAELAALVYLRTHTPNDALVQASPLNSWDRVTPYVAYYSGRRTYLSGISMMDTHNQPVQAPFEELKAAFISMSGPNLKGYLKLKGVSYLYLTSKPEDAVPYALSELGDVVFQNEGAAVIKL